MKKTFPIVPGGGDLMPNEPCRSRDLTCGKGAVFLWCIPTLALFVGLAWTRALPWLWIPAFVVMGVACLVNAARCGRLHCYVTGPVFLLAAAYLVLSEVNLVPMRRGIFLLLVFSIRCSLVLQSFRWRDM